MISLKTVSMAYVILQQAVTSGCFDYSVKHFETKFYSRRFSKAVSYQEPDQLNVIYLNTYRVENECGLVKTIAYWSNRTHDNQEFASQVADTAYDCCKKRPR